MPSTWGAFWTNLVDLESVKCENRVDLVKSFQTSVYLLNSASIAPRRGGPTQSLPKSSHTVDRKAEKEDNIGGKCTKDKKWICKECR